MGDEDGEQHDQHRRRCVDEQPVVKAAAVRLDEDLADDAAIGHDRRAHRQHRACPRRLGPLRCAKVIGVLAHAGDGVAYLELTEPAASETRHLPGAAVAHRRKENVRVGLERREQFFRHDLVAVADGDRGRDTDGGSESGQLLRSAMTKRSDFHADMHQRRQTEGNGRGYQRDEAQFPCNRDVGK
ncbi:MAG: hypothetical protein WBM03_18070 [Steroidobacteraceae bacterium]